VTEKMTIEEVADLLECTIQTVQVAAQEGRIAAVKYGRAWVFLRSAVMEGLQSEALRNAQPRTRPDLTAPAGSFGLVPQAEREAANAPNTRRRKVPRLG
jgi:excisionase family DNA binding protein